MRRMLLWKLSDKCNIACRYCWEGHRSHPVGQGKPLQNGALSAFVRRLSTLPSIEIVFSGGEPLASGQLIHVVKEAARFGVPYKVCTNATLVSKALLDSLGAWPPTHWCVSLDSLDQNVHNSLRGGFRDTCYGIHRLMQRQQGQLVVTTVLTKRNLPQLEDLVAFCVYHCIEFDAQLVALPVDHMYRKELGFNTVKEKGQIIAVLDRVISRYNAQTLGRFTSYYLECLRRYLLYGEFPNLRCPAGILCVIMEPDGSVIPCAYRATDVICQDLVHASLGTVKQLFDTFRLETPMSTANCANVQCLCFLKRSEWRLHLQV